MTTDQTVRPPRPRPAPRNPWRHQRTLQIAVGAGALIGGFAIGSVWLIVAGLVLAGTAAVWGR